MTEDYKKTLLDYITNMTPGQSTSAEIFKEEIEVARSEWIDFIPESWSQFKIEGLIKSRTSDKIILYGGYIAGSGTIEESSKGIIIVTDSCLKPIQTIYTFSSGTLLRPIQQMFQEEDGQFIAVDSTIAYADLRTSYVKTLLMTNPKRVIMLNDISQKKDDKYEVNLRRSYNLTGQYTNFICKDIFKNPSSSHYVFTGFKMVDDGNTSPDAIKMISLKINVGSPNEWWTYDSDDYYVYGGGYVYFDSNDDANWKFLITRNISSENKILVWSGKNATTSSLVTLQQESFNVYIDTTEYYNQVAFINENKAYYVMNNQNWGVSGTLRPKYIGLYEANLSNNTIREVYLKYLGDYDFSRLDIMCLQVVNGEIYIQYCDNVNTVNETANYYVQRYKGTWAPILVKENAKCRGYQRMFYVSQTFNILKLNLIPSNLREGTWYMEQITEIYNLANYNGENYENYNSLIAKYGNIYSDNKIIFSRNLHNLSITNNYTVASVEVPNTYLNDITFDIKELVGETNTTLISDSNPVSKNIYEVLYFNYINTLNVKDNENEIQLDASKYVNSNINVGTKTNHDNTKCTKLEIVYQDSTNKIFPIGWVSTDSTHKYTEFTIYVDKPISRLELISNDQTTTYITIEQELEVGKYYTFKQYLKVE